MKVIYKKQVENAQLVMVGLALVFLVASYFATGTTFFVLAALATTSMLLLYFASCVAAKINAITQKREESI